MRVLVACEFSGIVRDAFLEAGHDAWSCDLEPSESNRLRHFQEDVRGILDLGWDLMIAHPPCTYLATSGARWFVGREREQAEALEFVWDLMRARIPRWCIENPVGMISTKIRLPDQIVQPWMFGHGERKRTCFWLKNLPDLEPTVIAEGRSERVLKMGESKSRRRERSRFYPGIAKAMADQWGALGGSV